MKKNHTFNTIPGLAATMLAFILIATGCISQKELAYLNNLTDADAGDLFVMEIPEYRVQYRDNLYITIMSMTVDGTITDFLSSGRNLGGTTFMQGEAGQFLYGYDVNSHGKILLPVIGEVHVAGLTLEEIRNRIQESVSMIYTDATVECKLLSFRFTVIGEVRTPGAYINYNNYLTVLEAIGRAGGITDFGKRNHITVLRVTGEGTRTFIVNLQDKHILSSDAYFLMPNDVVIVEPEARKIFNLNLPAYSFMLTAVTSLLTTTLLLVNYFK